MDVCLHRFRLSFWRGKETETKGKLSRSVPFVGFRVYLKICLDRAQ